MHLASPFLHSSHLFNEHRQCFFCKKTRGKTVEQRKKKKKRSHTKAQNNVPFKSCVSQAGFHQEPSHPRNRDAGMLEGNAIHLSYAEKIGAYPHKKSTEHRWEQIFQHTLRQFACYTGHCLTKLEVNLMLRLRKVQGSKSYIQKS